MPAGAAYASRMKFLALCAACAFLTGCAASHADLARAALQIGTAATPATPGTAPGSGAGMGAGSVASGGTGYLPCAATPANRTAAGADCK